MAEIITELITESPKKIVLLVMDGLGGVRTAEGGSELFEASTPNLDRLAKEGSSGVHTVVGPGVTPGSGAGHLALFGYDPLQFELGRGALSAAGVGFELKPGDVAARVNFATVDESGSCTDRRAGRISSEENTRLVEKILANIDLRGRAELHIVTERDHRALLVLRGERLSPDLTDTDPQITGVVPPDPRPLTEEAEITAQIVRDILKQVREILRGEPANFILLRGFDTLRELPSIRQRYGLKGFGIAAYPMYVGISRLLGMEVAVPQASFADEVSTLARSYESYNFFYIHKKETDSAGEDGDFARKVRAIEEVDALIPTILEVNPDVLCVTGDHATPSHMKAHSWHPVPFLLWGDNVGVDTVDRFDEEAGRNGAFGHVLGKELMGFMLAAAGRLMKYGA